MGLIAGVLERSGISTVCLSCMEAIMDKVRPPRRLAVPYPLGYPLGRPGDRETQRRILERALGVLEREGPAPILEELS